MSSAPIRDAKALLLPEMAGYFALTGPGAKGSEMSEQTRARRRRRLTTKEWAAGKEIGDEWEALACSTEPADHASAEKGVRILYSEAGLDLPEITWSASPANVFRSKPGPGSLELELTGYDGVSMRDGADRISLKRQIDDALKLLIDEELLESVLARVADPVDRAFKRTVEKPVVAAAKLYVPVKRWASCHSHHIPINNWNTIGGPVLGLALAPSPGWIAAMEYLQEIGVLESPVITGYSSLRRATPWWWPAAGRVALLERPDVINTDSDGQLHADEGRAIIYRGGWGIRVRHGEVLDNPNRRSWQYPMGGTVQRRTLVVSPVDGFRP